MDENTILIGDVRYNEEDVLKSFEDLDKYAVTGGSIKLTQLRDDKEEPEEEPEEEPPFLLPEIEDYSDVPSMPNQLSDYAGTTKLLPPQFQSFSMEHPEGVSKLNEFLMKSYPQGAPSVKILSTTPQFCDKFGSWVVLVTYQPVKYRILIVNPDKP